MRKTVEVYTPPPDTNDQPFTWAYNAVNGVVGRDLLNQFIYIAAGYGDFVMRRFVGMGSVLDPKTGRFQVKDRDLNPLESDPEFVSPGSDDNMVIPERFYKETEKIGFDLYKFGINSGLASSFPEFVTPPPAATGFNTEGNQNNQPATFEDGLNRYMVLQDSTSTHLRVFKSTDQGVTWAEVNAAGAPAYQPTDAPAPFWFLFYGACRDSNPGVRKLYAVYFDSAAQKIAVATFNMATDSWSAGVVSALGYVNPATGITTGYGLAVAHRASDNSVIVCFSYTLSGPGINRNRVAFAKFAVGTATWDAALTPCGQVSAAVDDGDWFCAGLAQGTSGNIHIVFFVHPPLGTPATIRQQTLHPDNTLAAFQTLYTEPNASDLIIDTGPPFSYTLASQVEIIVPFFTRIGLATNLALKVVRGLSADAIVPLVQTVFTRPNTTDLLSGAAVCQYQGVAYIVYILGINTAPKNSALAYQTSPGYGQPWGPPVNVVQFPFADMLAPPSNVSFLTATGFSSSIGAVFPFFAGGVTFHQAYWEFNPNSPNFAAQIVFQGVRRMAGKLPIIGKTTKWKPKSFAYVIPGVGGGGASFNVGSSAPQINTAGSFPPAVGPALTVIQKVNDYDFELHELRISYTSSVPLPKSVAALMMFDAVKGALANIPVLDIFWNGAPLTSGAGAQYRNGAQVPPLVYPKETQIRIDFYSLVPSMTLPVTVAITLVGVQRVPCV